MFQVEEHVARLIVGAAWLRGAGCAGGKLRKHRTQVFVVTEATEYAVLAASRSMPCEQGPLRMPVVADALIRETP